MQSTRRRDALGAQKLAGVPFHSHTARQFFRQNPDGWYLNVHNFSVATQMARLQLRKSSADQPRNFARLGGHSLASPHVSKRKPAAAPAVVEPLVAAPEVSESAHEMPLDAAPLQEDGLWCGDGWTAKVIKNEDDEGWAVAMTLDGQTEPSLVGPWTMGRDKKNPKPLDANAFATLVKTASEIIMRHEQQTRATLHKSTKVATSNGRVRVTLDITPDEDEPYAELSAFDDFGTELARVTVAVNHVFNHDTATAWVASGFAKPASQD